MQQKIVSFDKDEEGGWFALLSCGHSRDVRHNPLWFNRPWVERAEGREHFLGTELNCKKCDNCD